MATITHRDVQHTNLAHNLGAFSHKTTDYISKAPSAHRSALCLQTWFLQRTICLGPLQGPARSCCLRLTLPVRRSVIIVMVLLLCLVTTRGNCLVCHSLRITQSRFVQFSWLCCLNSSSVYLCVSCACLSVAVCVNTVIAVSLYKIARCVHRCRYASLCASV